MGRKPKVEMGQLTATRPLELVFLDFVTLDKSSNGRDSMLVIIDAYTKFTKAVPTRNQLAVIVAKVLMNEWIFNYGTPCRIHTDQGRNFQAEIVAELYRLFGIKQSRTTPYHPQGNGQCERMHRSIINLLRTLNQNDKSRWTIHLPKLIHAYNVTLHASTGFTPFFMMFGREKNLPVDNRFGNIGLTEGDWIYETRRKMREVQILVGGRVDREKCNDKQEVDELEKGWQVRVRNRVLGRRTLENIWGDISWTVKGKFKDSSAYIY